MNYLIGDTIRLKATIKNLLGIEQAPASISVKIYTLDGTKIFEDAAPSLIPDTIAEYYSDWLINAVTKTTKLIALWEWPGHKKKMTFDVIPTY